MFIGRILLFVLGCSLFLVGCSVTKDLPENDHLLVKSKVKLEMDGYSTNKEFWEYELSKATRQRPNRKLFGVPYALLLYNLMGKKDKGIFKNLTEKPALFSLKDVEEDKLMIRNRLQEWGVFSCTISHDTILKRKKKRGVIYSVKIGKRRRIGSLKFAKSKSSGIDSLVKEAFYKGKFLNENAYYKLDDLSENRDFTATWMQDNGYYYFRPENLYYKADTSNSAAYVDLELNVQTGMNRSSLKPYRVGKIRVHYESINDESENRVEWQEDSLYFYGSNPFVRPYVVKKRLAFSEGELYSSTKHKVSQQYINRLGIVNQGRIVFSKNDSIDNILDCDVFLSRAKRFNIGLVADASYRTIGYWGPGLRLSFLDNDAFRRSVKFTAFVDGNLAFQVKDLEFERLSDQAYDISSGIQFDIPVVVSVFGKKLWQRSKASTVINLQHNFYHRPRYYQLQSLNFDVGYSWQPSTKTKFRWNFLDTEYYFLNKTTPRFDEELQSKPVFARSFENRLLLGASFQMEKSNMTTPYRGYRWITRIEAMGNILNWAQMLNDNEAWEVRPSRSFLDINYGQYVLIETDFSMRIPVSHRSVFAYRVALGTGLTLGNSDALPYAKQYFVGGASSVRAFKLRSFGPGGTSLEDNSFFTEQTGDIKFETSLELRKKIDELFELAFFLDAGNVWTSRQDSERPLAHFEFNRAFSEMALGTGLGFRLHTGIVIVRVDVGLPLRNPTLPANDRWTFSSSNIKTNEWQPRFNFTVGYPF